MIKWIKKHPTAFMIIVGVLMAFFLLCYWQRTIAVSNTIETKLEDLARDKEKKEPKFYTGQLKEKELEAYDYLKERLDNLEGGIVEFPEPLTGKQYTRVTAALEDEGYNYFYGVCDIPMTEDNVYVKYDGADIMKVKDPIIAKAVLFISCAKGIDTFGEYAEDGTVKNLDEIEKAYSENDPEKVKEIEKVKEETEKILDEIMQGLPEDAGEKSAVDYFLGWFEENLSVAINIGSETTQESGMTGLFEDALIYNNLSALTTHKASAVGYAKILTELCNRAGMESYIVFGTWGRKNLSSESYVLSMIEMNDQKIYVDASGTQSNDMGGFRYMDERGAMNHMVFADYFSYNEED
ncbi:MAG: hypothetical protein SOY12_01400 [Schaedlerella sp.]|nr:hypothetical protein [Lachnospiraceae bacterium]MDY4201713.1 hypothetical protein [Schaedlerella sp.]